MVTVSYHCPRCGAIAELERGAYLADKCVTPDPLDGWEYADAHEAADVDDSAVDDNSVADDDSTADDPYADANGVVIVCGAAETDGEGCGEPYYLSFVRFEGGQEVQPTVPAADVSFDFR